MSDELDLFGTPVAVPGRYVARPPTVPWSAYDDLALIPVLLACESQAGFFAACEFLCDALARPVAYAPGQRPDAKKVKTDMFDLIKMRTVTRTLSDRSLCGRDSAMVLARELFAGHRTGLPLTWAEREYFLKPHHHKPGNGEPQMGFDDLMCLLERGEGDGALVADALREIAACPNEIRPPNVRGWNPSPGLARVVRRFQESESAAPEERRVAWAYLHSACSREG